jgi:hypothetical protein
MNLSVARNAFLLIVLAAVAAAVFRIVTAPQRVKERRDTARNVCIGSGGEWLKLGNDEICRKPEPTDTAKKA